MGWNDNRWFLRVINALGLGFFGSLLYADAMAASFGLIIDVPAFIFVAWLNWYGWRRAR